MITQEQIDRINELYRKSKAEGLTSKEAEEQKTLRQEYIQAFKNNLRGTLETIKIQNPDGSVIDVKKRHDEKMECELKEEMENARINGN
ncbi:MAG: DUF896 domain-containing protein [Clostridia bacterium]|nr:DUF896 domain-containing protein [Clostridia bacterium]